MLKRKKFRGLRINSIVSQFGHNLSYDNRELTFPELERLIAELPDINRSLSTSRDELRRLEGLGSTATGADHLRMAEIRCSIKRLEARKERINVAVFNKLRSLSDRISSLLPNSNLVSKSADIAALTNDIQRVQSLVPSVAASLSPPFSNNLLAEMQRIQTGLASGLAGTPNAVATQTFIGPGGVPQVVGPGLASQIVTGPGGVPQVIPGVAGQTVLGPGGFPQVIPGVAGQTVPGPGGVPRVIPGVAGQTVPGPGGVPQVIPGVAGQTVPGPGGVPQIIPGIAAQTVPGLGGVSQIIPGVAGQIVPGLGGGLQVIPGAGGLGGIGGLAGAGGIGGAGAGGLAGSGAILGGGQQQLAGNGGYTWIDGSPQSQDAKAARMSNGNYYVSSYYYTPQGLQDFINGLQEQLNSAPESPGQSEAPEAGSEAGSESGSEAGSEAEAGSES